VDQQQPVAHTLAQRNFQLRGSLCAERRCSRTTHALPDDKEATLTCFETWLRSKRFARQGDSLAYTNATMSPTIDGDDSAVWTNDVDPAPFYEPTPSKILTAPIS
jgi:hypothetical protein